MKQRKTLVEWMIIGSIGVVGVAIVGGIGAFGFRGCISNKDQASDAARAWAEDMGMEVQGVSCVDFDSDNDGYVSCTVNDGEETHALECAARFRLNSGCRKQKFRAQSQ